MFNHSIVRGILVVLAVTVPASIGFAGDSQISYSLTELGGGSWQYSYEVGNISLPAPIEEFTIWFDYSLYENLVITTPNPPANDWDELAIQPEPVIGDDGFYDGLTEIGNPGISIGETVNDFSVSFNWLGINEPGSQFYEIIDPVTFGTIDSGWTVPEPATSLLLIAGCFGVFRKRRN